MSRDTCQLCRETKHPHPLRDEARATLAGLATAFTGNSPSRWDDGSVDRDSDLVLEWNEGVTFGRAAVPSEVAFLFIVNRRDSICQDDRGEYWAFVSVFDARSGKRLPSHVVAIGGVGRTYRLLPSERVEVPAAFFTDLRDLPSGPHELEATISELSLRSPRVSIEI